MRVSGSRSIDRDVPSYFQSLEHLLRYCARPPFALERLSVSRGAGGRIARIRYALPRHKAANWVGPGRGRKAPLTRHLTDCVGQTDGAGGGGVSARVPELRRRHPAESRRPAGAGLLRTGGSHAEEGQDGFARVKSAPHTPRRTARAASRLARPRPAHRLGELVQIHDDRAIFQASPDELPAIDIHSL